MRHEIPGEQSENRTELATGSQRFTGVKADNVDYQVLVPADACVILITAAGSLSVENLEGMRAQRPETEYDHDIFPLTSSRTNAAAYREFCEESPVTDARACALTHLPVQFG